MSNLYVNRVSTVDSTRLQSDVTELLTRLDAHSTAQLSLTSSTGEDNWNESIGRMMDLKFPERYYSVLNNSLKDTYIDQLISEYPEFYRWRLLRLGSMNTYTVHKDSFKDKRNLRLHIPVFTNKDAFLCFYNEKPYDGSHSRIVHCHLQEGISYEVDTSSWHTAVNYGSTVRYHIVGVRYE